MKIKDVKHNHSLTDLLKVGIFSILMLAPMINVGVRSAYVICNKNAYQSYYGETINETNYNNISNTNELKVGETYYFNNSQPYDSDFVNTGITLLVQNFHDYVGESQQNVNNNANGIIRLYFANSTSLGSYVALQTEDYTTIKNVDFSNPFSFYFDFISISSNTLDNVLYNDLFTISHNNYSYLDNVFEYSVNQLTESPLYNWVENTAIYSGVALMNTQLGITQPVISLLLVYWLLLTIIYIIIDIIIRVFTWLTHMIGSKTA